jgi:hypothetical protein
VLSPPQRSSVQDVVLAAAADPGISDEQLIEMLDRSEY